MIDRDNWGCEYLDDHVPPMPFSPRTPQIFHINMDILDKIVDRRYINEISSRDSAQIQDLIVSIARYGVLRPGNLYYDKVKIRFQDGNHRYLAAKALQLETFPVTLQRVERLPGAGAYIDTILEFFLYNHEPLELEQDNA